MRTSLSSSGSSIVVEDRLGIRRSSRRLEFRRVPSCLGRQRRVRVLAFSMGLLPELASGTGGAYTPGMSDCIIMVKVRKHSLLLRTRSSSSSQNQAQVFLGGPPLVKMAYVVPPYALTS